MNVLKEAKKFWSSAKTVGIAETFLRVLHRFRIISVLHSFDFALKELGVRDGILIMNSFDESTETKVCEINDLRITLREIKEDELENLDFAEGIFSVETFREHFARGLRFFAAFHKGAVVCVNGIHMKYAHLVYIKRPVVELPEGVAYLNCAMTSPGYRSHGIGTVVRTFLLARLWREGYKQIVSAVFTENSGALRWNSTNGFHHWWRVSYIHWLGHDLWLKRLTKVGRRHANLLDNVIHEERPSTKLSQEVIAS